MIGFVGRYNKLNEKRDFEMANLASVKKGDTVAVVGFTGIRLSDSVVVAATKTTITLNKKNGDEMVFDRKTGEQTNMDEGKEKYANKIMSVEDAPTNKDRAKRKKKNEVKKAAKAPVVEVEEEDEDEEDEEEEEEAPAPKKKAAAKAPAKPAKKAKKVVADEEDEYEEL